MSKPKMNFGRNCKDKIKRVHSFGVLNSVGKFNFVIFKKGMTSNRDTFSGKTFFLVSGFLSVLHFCRGRKKTFFLFDFRHPRKQTSAFATQTLRLEFVKGH